MNNSANKFGSLRKWQKTRNALNIQSKWRVGLLFRLKPKRNELLKYLKDMDLRVSTFEDPEALFKHLAENQDLALIFYDWEPRKDPASGKGLNFLGAYRQFVKRNALAGDVPIILATHHFTGNDLALVIRQGARDILIMPTTIEIVGEKILANLNKVEDKLKVIAETDGLVNRAEEYVRMGNYRGAIKIYEEMVQEHGAILDVLEKNAEAHLRAGQIDEAITLYKQCVAIEKRDVRAYQGLGNCYCQLGMHRKARESYSRVLQIEPENAFVDHKIGRTFMMENNLIGAGRHFEEAIKRNPHFFEIYEDLARIKCDHQHTDEAVEILKKFTKDYPEDMRGHICYAETLIEAERYLEAEDAVQRGIEEAIKGNSEPPVALYNRWGIALRKQEKYQAAIEKYELALKIEPNNPEIHFNIAKAYFESGDRSGEVMKRFTNCFKIDPTLKEEFWEDRFLKPLHEFFPRPDKKSQ